MKILVLDGSQKRDKSDTMHMMCAFLDGMNDAAPQDIRIIDCPVQHLPTAERKHLVPTV